MTCEGCNTERFRLRFVENKFICYGCLTPSVNDNFLISKIVTFHDSEGKPIKATQARINMIKRRYLCPEDGVSVLMRDSMGKKTDRRGYNY